MKTSLLSLMISLLFAFLVLISHSVREILHQGLTLTLYVPLLKVESSLEDLVKIRRERDRLVSENFALLRKLSGYAEIKLDSLWDPEMSVKGVKVLSFDPLGIPYRIFIEGGERNGFKYGDPVIQHSHLVGKIVEVNKNTSTVLTLFNPSLRVGVVDLRSGVLGVLEGGLPPQIDYVPVDADVREGDTLVTSGLGGIFPRGIPVASVSKVKRERGKEMFLFVEARPFIDFSLLGRVEVLKK